MIYSEWNEHVAKYFFKPENAGKDVLFYLTKQDLIKYSRQHFSRASDDEIWANFIHAIKYGQQAENDIRVDFPVMLTR